MTQHHAMKKLLFLFLLLVSCSQAEILTVCATDVTCDHTGTADDGQAIRDAAAAVSCGGVVELRAGDLWPNSQVSLPDKGCSKFTYLVSSRWYQRPAGRLDPARDQHLLATLRQYNVNEPVIDGFENYYAQNRILISSVNTSTETITFNAAHGRTDGDRVACRGDNLGQAAGSGLPAGIGEATTYYVVASTSTTYKLAQTLGGTPINLTGSPTATSYCALVKPSHHWWISAIEIAPDPGTAPPNALVRFSHDFYSPEALPHHIIFDFVYIHGWAADNGPKNCMDLNSVRFSAVRNSYISSCKFESDESHAIFAGTVSYKLTIENNYMEGASMCILTGGTGLLFEGRVEYLDIIGNHCNTPGYMARTFPTDPVFPHGALDLDPSGGCFWDPYTQTGAYWRNTISGDKFRCQSNGTWVLDNALPTYTALMGNKARFEIKQGWYIRILNNLITHGWGNGDTGNPGACVLCSGVEPYQTATIKYVETRNNKCYRTSRFIVTAVGNPAYYTEPFGPFVTENNLGIEQARFPEMSQHTVTSAFYVTGLHATSYIDGNTYRHNTLTSNGTTPHRWWQMDLGASWDATNFDFSDNIMPTGNAVINGSTADCTTLATHFPNTPKRIKNSVVVGTGGSIGFTSTCTENLAEETTISLESDYSITPASKYSKTCSLGGGCGFLATDGKEVGVEAPKLHQAVSGSERGQGGWLEDARIHIGSGHAAISWTSNESCTVKLYTDAARTTLHADTSDSGEQADSRAGNLVSGQDRTFVFGTNNPLTASTMYYPLIACGTRVRPMEFKTKAAGAGRLVRVGYSTARTGQFTTADDPDFSDPIGSFSSSAEHLFTVGSNTVAWYRETGGKAQVFIEP